MTARGRSVLFTPVPWSSLPSKTITVPPGALRLMAGGKRPTLVPEGHEEMMRWLPGTTKVSAVSLVHVVDDKHHVASQGEVWGAQGHCALIHMEVLWNAMLVGNDAVH
eukprot:CAMPEP_0180577108 /NCGR_PEP_ID=MMETSP1037_2-20121125/11765_1 /TAXON_ID=632150 /ORGANISM="Azadinium spinosum, Strain 3D9" /LENGTH=107 /DNA_ID=CAMNT_0022594847 /DNA_START=395 /DNA_END=718 /DNA_ORIENTATION=-